MGLGQPTFQCELHVLQLTIDWSRREAQPERYPDNLEPLGLLFITTTKPLSENVGFVRFCKVTLLFFLALVFLA